MTPFWKKPLHEKIIIIVLLALFSFFAIIKIFSYFNLSNAVAKGDISRVKLLLKLGFDVNAKNRLTGQPIDFAVYNDNKDLLELLISHGADINSIANDGETLLQRAIMLNKKASARTLIEKGAQLNDCSLYWAVREGDKELVELLLAKGLDVNAVCHPPRLKIRPTQEYLHAPLYAAMHKDSSEVAEVLIDRGVIINPHATKSYTPLHAAASNRARKTLKLLISRGAKINATDQEGHTPLYYATKTEDIEVQQILIAAGAIRK
jgi:ankyrin repeat protein